MTAKAKALVRASGSNKEPTGFRSAGRKQLPDTRDPAAILGSEIRYRRLFEAARDGILILDPDTRKITDANPFMTELLAYPHNELVGKELWEIGLMRDEKACRVAFCDLQKEGFIRYEDLPLQDRNGRRREVEFVSNLYEEAGRKVIQCNIRDITERKQAEKALLAAQDEIGRHALQLEQVIAERTSQLRESIEELEGFSYSIAHDMRAPLRAMQGFAACLEEEYGSKLDEQGINYLQLIMRSAVRLDQLIQDVLSYSRIIHARLPMGRVDLDCLVRDIVKNFPTEQPIKPEIQIKGKLPMVVGNEALLSQCVMNLLSNGVKFVSPGTTPLVQVSSEAMGDGSIRVWFKDNGIGIAPKDHDRIFRLFEQVHSATEYGGTGLGLTIVRKAIERMGAQTGFESELGKGSKFWIQLKKALLIGFFLGHLVFGSAAAEANPLESLKSFSELAPIDLGKLHAGEIRGEPGSLMQFANGFWAETCFVVPAKPEEVARRLQRWNPSLHPTLKAIEFHQVSDPCRPADFEGLIFRPGNRPLQWLLGKSLATTARKSELNLSRAEASQLGDCVKGKPDPGVVASCWARLLLERAAAFQRDGFSGIAPYELSVEKVSPAIQLRELVRERPAVAREFAALLRESGVLGDPRPVTLQAFHYWSVYEANHRGTLTLGVVYLLPLRDRYQLLDAQYYVSGTYYTSVTLYEVWPTQIGEKPGALVWRGDFFAAPGLAYTKGLERLAYGAIMLKELKKTVRLFQDDILRPLDEKLTLPLR